MKKLLPLLVISFIFGCKGQHLNKKIRSLENSKTFEISTCPSNGTCSIEIIPRSKLQIKEDEFKNTYIEIAEGDKIVFKYEYKKDELPNTADSGYRELVYIETDGTNQELNLKNQELQKVNMVFGRLCFCKGSSGYFKVKKGQLKFVLKKNELTLDTHFSVAHIPQVITEIDETITLEY